VHTQSFNVNPSQLVAPQLCRDASKVKMFNIFIVKQYHELTPLSRICTPILYTGPHYVKWACHKKLPSTLHQSFTVCRGHKVGHNDIVLSGFNEGILRGKEKFLTLHISPLGGQGTPKFFCVREAYRPHVLTKYWAIEFKRGMGCSQKISPFFGSPAGHSSTWTP